MDYRHIKTGVIYHVTNKGLLSIYESSPFFEQVKKEPEEKPKKKTTKKTKR